MTNIFEKVRWWFGAHLFMAAFYAVALIFYGTVLLNCIVGALEAQEHDL